MVKATTATSTRTASTATIIIAITTLEESNSTPTARNIQSIKIILSTLSTIAGNRLAGGALGNWRSRPLSFLCLSLFPVVPPPPSFDGEMLCVWGAARAAGD